MYLLTFFICREVRKAVLRNISPSAITLPHILKRARDNAADIRAIVFKVLLIHKTMQKKKKNLFFIAANV